LLKEGIIFQYSEEIFLAASLSKQIKINRRKIIYRKLKDEILLNEKALFIRINITGQPKKGLLWI